MTTQFRIDNMNRARGVARDVLTHPVADLIRLELESRELPPSRKLKGRVYLALNQPSKIEKITLIVTKNSCLTYPNENIKVNDRGSDEIIHLPVEVAPPKKPENPSPYPFYVFDGYSSSGGSLVSTNETTLAPPLKITTLDPVVRQLNFKAGKYAIPIMLYVPETEMPTFAYSDPQTGVCFTVNTSMCARILISEGLYMTQAIPIVIPALGGADGLIQMLEDGKEIICPRKYYTHGDEVRVVVGDHRNTIRDVQVRIQCRLDCRAGRLEKEIAVYDYHSLKMKTGSKSDVVREIHGASVKYEGTDSWKRHWEISNLKVTNDFLITFNSPEFSLNYFLQVKIDDVEYETPICVVDYLGDSSFKPPQICSDIHDTRTFNIKVPSH